MKKMAWVVAVVLCSSVLMFAGDKNDAGKGTSMTGTVCNAKCVTTAGKKSSCDKNCTETAGDMVFIDSKGKVMRIGNQDKVSGMSGKRVKVKASLAGDMMHIDDIAPVSY